MGIILRELEYPFDADMILQKQRKYKRLLLADRTDWIDKKIAILGGSTTNDFKNMLELFLLDSGIRPIFYESEYNKYYEDAVFDNEQLKEFEPEIIIIYTTSVNLMNLPRNSDRPEEVDNKLRNEYQRFETIWNSIERRYNAVIIQNNFDYFFWREVGNSDCSIDAGIGRYIAEMNALFSKYARVHSAFHINDINYLSYQIGQNSWHDLSAYFAYKHAISYKAMPYVGLSAARIIRALYGRNKKCLVLDLDNTLWGGVIGDDGKNNIKIGNETPVGEAYSTFQRYCLQLKDRRILLAVNSKNYEEVAKAGFDLPDSVLKYEDFISFKANWEPKNVNMESIAQEINIGLDSLVYIDDNPAERQIIRDMLPMVAVPEVEGGKPASYIKALEGNGYFDAVAISADDLKRNEQYSANKQRNDLEKSALSYDDFLISLGMTAEIKPFKELYFDRIAQLTNKSNQFNLTTRRFSVSDIEKMAKDEQDITLYGRLKDKFGDNGLVSVVIGKMNGTELDIILWLMSCRVLKRGFEFAMLDEFVKSAISNGVTKIHGFYYKTAKNMMVENLYQTFGFNKIRINGDDTEWELDNLGSFSKKGRYISVDGVGND